MVRVLNLFFVVAAIFIVSCGKENALIEKMAEIKTIGDENPQLAMMMLDSLNIVIRNQPESVVMKYDLLKLRLQDKAYIVATSDIVAKQLVHYYDEYGSLLEKQETYYYAGSVYRDLQDTPRALEYFLKSLELAETHTECDSVMRRNTYSNLCYLYFGVQDYQHALEIAKKQYNLSKEIKNTDILCLIQMANCLSALDSIEQTSKILVTALNTIWADSQLHNDIESIHQLFVNFSYIKDTVNAEKCYSLLEHQKTINNNNARLASYDAESSKNVPYAMYFELIGKNDSAIYYYQRILQDGADMFRVYDASKALFRIYNKKGDIAEANKYADMYIQISDSIDLGKRQIMAATVNNEFQYHLDKNKEQRVMEENNRFRFLLLVSCMAGITILLIASIIIIYRRNKHLKELLAISNERNRLIIEMEEKERQLSESVQQNQTFLNLLHQSELANKAEDVINTIRQSSEGKKNMQPADWKQLYKAVDELYPTFKDKLLKELGTFSEQQMQVCYLMRIGLSKPQIQNVTNLSRVTVWRWVKKYDWVQGEEVSDSEL